MTHALDTAVVAAYLLLTLGVGFALAQRASTAEDYFLGARRVPTPKRRCRRS